MAEHCVLMLGFRCVETAFQFKFRNLLVTHIELSQTFRYCESAIVKANFFIIRCGELIVGESEEDTAIVEKKNFGGHWCRTGEPS